MTFSRGALPLVVVLLLQLACTSLFSAALPAAPPSASPPSSVNLLPTTTPTVPPIPLPAEFEAALPSSVLWEMETIESQVSSLRGLFARQVLRRELISADQLRHRVRDDFLADYTPDEATRDTRVASILGLLPPDFDLWSFYTDLFNERVAGFYDLERQAMVVVSDNDFGILQRLTYAHEFTHALQDQAFDLEAGVGYNEAACESDHDRCAALQALIEGDAVLLSDQWLAVYPTPSEIEALINAYAAVNCPVFEAAPRVLQREFLFPYVEGLAFVRQLHLGGGWAAVDRSYANPPRSSEQILHPDRYPRDQPQALVFSPDLPPQLGAEWELLEEGVLGEFRTLLMLEEYLPADQAAAAVAGWGGDRYQVLYRPSTDQTALVLITAWDRRSDARQAFQALESYADRRFGTRQIVAGWPLWETAGSSAYLEQAAFQTLLIIAPHPQLALSMRQTLLFPAETQ